MSGRTTRLIALSMAVAWAGCGEEEEVKPICDPAQSACQQSLSQTIADLLGTAKLDGLQFEALPVDELLEDALDMLWAVDEVQDDLDAEIHWLLGMHKERRESQVMSDVEDARDSVAAFYLPRERRIVMLEGPSPDSFAGTFVMLHELAHAYQDELFDLDRRLTETQDRGRDAEMALRAMVEGHATIMGLLGIFQRTQGGADSPEMRRLLPDLGADMRDSMAEGQAEAEEPWTSVRGVFPYAVGTAFVARKLRDPDLPLSADRLILRPPKTTATVLGLEAQEYWDSRDLDAEGEDPTADELYFYKDWDMGPADLATWVLGTVFDDRLLEETFRGWTGGLLRMRLTEDLEPVLLLVTTWTGGDAGTSFAADLGRRLGPARREDRQRRTSVTDGVVAWGDAPASYDLERMLQATIAAVEAGARESALDE